MIIEERRLSQVSGTYWLCQFCTKYHWVGKLKSCTIRESRNSVIVGFTNKELITLVDVSKEEMS